MSNHYGMERMMWQTQEEFLRKAQPFWELQRSRSEAPKPIKAKVWLKRLGAFFRVWIPKRQQSF